MPTRKKNPAVAFIFLCVHLFIVIRTSLLSVCIFVCVCVREPYFESMCSVYTLCRRAFTSSSTAAMAA